MAILKKNKKEEKKDAPVKAEKKAPAKKVAKKSEEKAAAPKAKKPVAKSDAYRVLLRPMITEKAAQLATDGVYVFEVAPGAGKIEVRDAVRALYGVTPRKVNIMNRKGKRVRFGRLQGKRRSWRKAHVYLPAGKHLDVYEGV